MDVNLESWVCDYLILEGNNTKKATTLVLEAFSPLKNKFMCATRDMYKYVCS